jgi:hypothetical protein
MVLAVATLKASFCALVRWVMEWGHLGPPAVNLTIPPHDNSRGFPGAHEPKAGPSPKHWKLTRRR